MAVHLFAQILAVIWIAISLWMLWVNGFILALLLTGMGEPGGEPPSIRDELCIVLFFLISGTAVYTWAFDLPANIPRNVGYMLVVLALFTLPSIAIRLFYRHQRM